MNRALYLATIVAAAVWPCRPAQACSIIVPPDYEGSSKQFRDVRAAIDRATAIVDGEVIRPASQPRNQSALVRVHHRIKGEVPDVIEVGAGGGGDCSIALDRKGERSRLILDDGPRTYLLYRDQSEARIEDRILKSDRRKVWPYYAGQPSEPMQGKTE